VTHISADAVQSMQLAPVRPHAVSSVPTLQLPFVSQHPAQFDWQTFADDGGLQTLMGRLGTAASGPQVSPALRHSADDRQSCTGPIGV
jgi:hypothetical protein